jgi:NAD-dependent dihydropyrimidine dehydrogenase PreA subunit
MAAKIEIDKESCTSCRTCVKACFLDIMRWDEVEKKPVVAYEAECVWCFTCEINCPVHCINVVPAVSEQTVSPY